MLLDQFFDSSPQPLLMTDAHHICIRGNPAAAKLFQLEPAQLEGRPVLDLLGLKSSAAFPPAGVIHVKLPSGKLLPLTILSLTPDRSVYLLLQRSEELHPDAFLRLAEAIPQIVWTGAPSGALDYINPRFFEYTGMKPETFTSETWLNVIHPDDLPAIMDHSKLLEAGIDSVLEHQFRIRRVDQTYRWFLARSIRIKDATGSVVRRIGTATDIDAQKRVEESLRDSEARFKATFEQAAAGIAILSNDGRFVRCNQKYATTLGYVPEELVGRHFQEFTYPEDRMSEDAAYQGLVNKTLSTHSREKRYCHRDGRLIWATLNVNPIRNDEGEIQYFVAVSIEITAIKEAQSKLEQAIRARDEFLSIASHELKTPIASLRLQGELQKRLIERGPFAAEHPTKATKLINNFDTRLKSLARLVDEMLDVSRINLGKLALNPTRIDLSALVREEVENFASVLSGAGCTFTMEIDQEIFGLWDRYRLEQVVTNLLTNIIKYAPGKPVHVKTTREKGWAHLTLVDQGIGIPDEFQKLIFQKFERAVDERSGIVGLGLGLYISREICTAHGGNLTVQSTLGQGSTFTVSLPLPP